MKVWEKNIDLLVSLEPSLYREHVILGKKGRTGTIFQIGQGCLWPTQVCSDLLPKATGVN